MGTNLCYGRPLPTSCGIGTDTSSLPMGCLSMIDYGSLHLGVGNVPDAKELHGPSRRYLL